MLQVAVAKLVQLLKKLIKSSTVLNCQLTNYFVPFLVQVKYIFIQHSQKIFHSDSLSLKTLGMTQSEESGNPESNEKIIL